ncbi:MAG: hypothetical protein AAF456_08740 [Planctomycetota bacterium]
MKNSLCHIHLESALDMAVVCFGVLKRKAGVLLIELDLVIGTEFVDVERALCIAFAFLSDNVFCRVIAGWMFY